MSISFSARDTVVLRKSASCVSRTRSSSRSHLGDGQSYKRDYGWIMKISVFKKPVLQLIAE